ncbi:ATP synthase F0 subunit A [Alicyclobacillaceae bacterium I2511]|nr:ATP synthase F0 subunit A [Alicyclobacillaceae bacterium I2511]
MDAFPYLWSNTLFKVNLTTWAMTVLTGLIVFIVLRLGVRHLDMRHPRGMQNLLESAVEFTSNIAKNTMPNQQAVRWVLPFAFTTLIYLFVANWLGLVATVALHMQHPLPWLGLTATALATAHGKVILLDSPTANMSFSLGLALLVWLISHGRGLRHPKMWLKHFISPSPFMLPFNIIEEFTNPLTHGMRLYGNIFAGEALIGVLVGAPLLWGFVPWSMPLLFVWLIYSAFVSTIQAYVFTILLTLYIGNKSHEPQEVHHGL